MIQSLQEGILNGFSSQGPGNVRAVAPGSHLGTAPLQSPVCGCSRQRHGGPRPGPCAPPLPHVEEGGFQSGVKESAHTSHCTLPLPPTSQPAVPETGSRSSSFYNHRKEGLWTVLSLSPPTLKPSTQPASLVPTQRASGRSPCPTDRKAPAGGQLSGRQVLAQKLLCPTGHGPRREERDSIGDRDTVPGLQGGTVSGKVLVSNSHTILSGLVSFPVWKRELKTEWRSPGVCDRAHSEY